jgi:hypothetical protein
MPGGRLRPDAQGASDARGPDARVVRGEVIEEDR